MSEIKITAEEKEIYDRNMRVWGNEIQKKLKKSCVFLFKLDEFAFELGKNLGLSGISIAIHDDAQEKVTTDDEKSNFYINSKDVLDQVRVDECFILRMTEICSFISISKCKISDLNTITSKYICVSNPSYQEIFLIEKIGNEEDKFFYMTFLINGLSFVYSNCFSLKTRKKFSLFEENSLFINRLNEYNKSVIGFGNSISDKMRKRIKLNILLYAFHYFIQVYEIIHKTQTESHMNNDESPDYFKDIETLNNSYLSLHDSMGEYSYMNKYNLLDYICYINENFIVNLNKNESWRVFYKKDFPTCQIISGMVNLDIISHISSIAEVSTENEGNNNNLYVYDSGIQHGLYFDMSSYRELIDISK